MISYVASVAAAENINDGGIWRWRHGAAATRGSA